VRHPFFKGIREDYELGVALMWGTLIVAVVLGVLAQLTFYSKVSCSVE